MTQIKSARKIHSKIGRNPTIHILKRVTSAEISPLTAIFVGIVMKRSKTLKIRIKERRQLTLHSIGRC